MAADFQAGLQAYRRGDYATALEEWLSLAEQGNATAQYRLGFMYADGEGVAQDYVLSHMWFNLAAAHLPADVIQESAATQRSIIEPSMTPAPEVMTRDPVTLSPHCRLRPGGR